jgi:D-alanyl-D-alanine carboxypeptidase
VTEIPLAYRQRIGELHRALGIPRDYAQRTGLALQLEPEELVEVSPGRGDKRHWLAPFAAARWAQLEAAAQGAGIALRLVSAYRSPEYQAALIERKLERGELISEILRVNAAPGYSEHHTGCAVDLGVAGLAPLTRDFEDTEAFRWLYRHAQAFGFHLSYPVDNPYGIIYEPWHWAVLPVSV